MREMKSLVGSFWGGYCPECSSVDTEMLLNSAQCWECPSCGLQIQVGDSIVILAQSGIGRFVKHGVSNVLVTDAVTSRFGTIVADYRFEPLLQFVSSGHVRRSVDRRL